MEFEIVKEQLPVIQINFEEMKSALSETLEKYKGYIVTEDNLSLCKTTQKELASTRIKIDEYRKTKKKELSKPIAKFEDECNQLFDLVVKAEEPIKEGIKVFDDMTREKKRLYAVECINKSIEDQQLNDKYASQLSVLDNYTNLTAKDKATLEDVQIRAEVLKQQQTNELEMLEIIKDTIENANKNINAKMSLMDFQVFINSGTSTKLIISEINSRAERIKKSEIEAEELRIKKELEAKQAEEEKQRIAALPQEEPVEEIKREIPVVEVKAETSSKTINEPITVSAPMWQVEIKVIGIKTDIAKLGQYLKDNNYNYTVVKQTKID